MVGRGRDSTRRGQRRRRGGVSRSQEALERGRRHGSKVPLSPGCSWGEMSTRSHPCSGTGMCGCPGEMQICGQTHPALQMPTGAGMLTYTDGLVWSGCGWL